MKDFFTIFAKLRKMVWQANTGFCLPFVYFEVSVHKDGPRTTTRSRCQFALTLSLISLRFDLELSAFETNSELAGMVSLNSVLLAVSSPT